MTIKVTFDFEQRKYVVSNNERQVASLPLAYLEGARNKKGTKTYIHQDDIELAFAKAYGEGLVAKSYTTDLQRRHAAFAELGLIHEPA